MDKRDKTSQVTEAVESVPTVAIATQGCKLNQADSQVLARRFADAGYRVVEANQGPQVFVLNTCTVTGTADSKARRALRAARRANPHALVVATGCYAQRAPEDLAGMDAVSLVIGNFKKDQLVSIVSNALASGALASGALASGALATEMHPAGEAAKGFDGIAPDTKPKSNPSAIHCRRTSCSAELSGSASTGMKSRSSSDSEVRR